MVAHGEGERGGEDRKGRGWPPMYTKELLRDPIVYTLIYHMSTKHIPKEPILYKKIFI